MHLKEVYFRYSEAFRGRFRYLQKQREFVRYLEMKARVILRLDSVIRPPLERAGPGL